MATDTLAHYLDNPVWHTLRGAHANLAVTEGDVLRYPPAYAPFVSVDGERAVVENSQSLDSKRYFLGPIPAEIPSDWHPSPPSPVLQMVRPFGGNPPDQTRAVLLTDIHRDAMNALTAVAFPDFFRNQTADLGPYYGVVVDGELVSMAGERMSVPGAQEISGVCTAPGYTGQGFGRDVMLALVARHHALGVASFLHVSESNVGAIRLYEKLGFIRRAVLPLTVVSPVPLTASDLH
jgi:ribosomal protein S18 acetylase RimI-like enzyme